MTIAYPQIAQSAPTSSTVVASTTTTLQQIPELPSTIHVVTEGSNGTDWSTVLVALIGILGVLAAPVVTEMLKRRSKYREQLQGPVIEFLVTLAQAGESVIQLQRARALVLAAPGYAPVEEMKTRMDEASTANIRELRKAQLRLRPILRKGELRDEVERTTEFLVAISVMDAILVDDDDFEPLSEMAAERKAELTEPELEELKVRAVLKHTQELIEAELHR